MIKDDKKIANRIIKKVNKYPGFRFFIASKRGGNTKGDGANRSVILAKYPDKDKWFQFVKIWGENNEHRAVDIINEVRKSLAN